jgi:DNA-binding CsgD family transcriptional regulator
MGLELRQTGIDVLPEISWGAHFCTFYETKADLLDMVLPYFKVGLENNEFCIWVVSDPITEGDAKQTLCRSDAFFEQHLADGNIEILNGHKWYLKGNKVDAERIIGGWHRKLRRALSRGYKGLRVSGNAFWLATNDWQDFSDYELSLDEAIEGHPIIALCTYALGESQLADLLDVARAHQFAVARRNGAWQLIHATQPQVEATLLTSRETEALALAAQGNSASEIGRILQITKRTVDEHIQTATRKLRAANRTQAVAIAIRDRLISV